MPPNTNSDADLQRLVERIEGGERNNSLDVEIEVALFEPDNIYESVRANAAGTKVIFTTVLGYETTHWADDHTLTPQVALAALRTRLARNERSNP